jgi:peptidoglycan/xylan/chitin deacetylase (PgdA/CDA1 family)
MEPYQQSNSHDKEITSMSAGIPVFMYHSLEGLPGPVKKVPCSTTISPESFEMQMELLYQMGYSTISIDNFFMTPFNDVIEGGKRVIITFDDGYYTTFRDADPILSKYKFIATLFLPTQPVGKSSFHNFQGFDRIKDDRPLTWEEIKKLDQKGWSIQSHGQSHSRMSGLSAEQIMAELLQSKKIIEHRLGKKVRYFAYPFGDYDRRVLHALGNTGYEAAFTVHTGKAENRDSRFRLCRIEINNMDTKETFLHKLKTGYSSGNERWRAALRDILYKNTLVKDLLSHLKK